MNVKKDLLPLILIIFISLCVIGLQYSSIPAHLSFDEFSFAKLALSLDNTPFTLYSPQATGHTTPYFYILLLSLKLFDITTTSLRLPSALFGIMTIGMFYLLSRKLFTRIDIAFLTTMSFLSMRWFFGFARFSFEATFLLFLEITSLYFFVTYVKNKSFPQLIIAAFFAALAFYSYTPGRIFFIVPALILLFQKQFRPLVLYTLTVMLCIIPLLISFSQKPDSRVSELSILSRENKTEIVIQNGIKTALMFHASGDMNGRHNFPGKPALNPILGIVFVIGFLYALRTSKKNTIHQLFIIYFFVSLIPTLFTPSADNPNMLRTVTAIPSIIYFIGVLFVYLLELFKKQEKIVLITITAFLLFSSLYEFRTYFIFQSRVFKNAFEITCPLSKVVAYEAKTLAEIPKTCRVAGNLF